MNSNLSAILGGLAAIFIALILLAAFTGTGEMSGMGQMMSGGMMGVGVVGLLFVFLFGGILAALVVGVRLLTSRR